MALERNIDIKLYSSGYCTANNKFVHPSSKTRRAKFYATWALIDHPLLGHILFDTGYSEKFFEGTKSFPSRIYRWITPVYIDAKSTCLETLGPEIEIDHLVLSHFHPDHSGGISNFKKAKIWCHRDELKFAESRNELNGFINGILKNHIPGDINSRVVHPELKFKEKEFSGLKGWTWAENIHFVYLPGHSIGQIGLLLNNTNLGDILLCADAAWSLSAIKQKIYPSKLVSVFVSSYPKLVSTLDSLHEFSLANPDVRILPTHCPLTAKLTTR